MVLVGNDPASAVYVRNKRRAAQKVGIRAIDVVDFDYPAWHTPDDDLSKVSAASLQIVGDVAMAVIRLEVPTASR